MPGAVHNLGSWLVSKYKQALNNSRQKHMLPDTEKYSYQLFTSTNVCSINLLHSLLGQHSTAGSSMLSVINHVYWTLHMYPSSNILPPAWYCWYPPLNEFITGMLTYSSAATPLHSILGTQLWSTGDYSRPMCLKLAQICCSNSLHQSLISNQL